MQLPSKHLDKAVEAISSLPGIGRRTALRLALFLLKQPQDFALDFGDAIHNLVKNAKRCVVCNNISDHDTCSICASVKRDKKTICVVEDIRDVMAIEGTPKYCCVPSMAITTIFWIIPCSWRIDFANGWNRTC